MACADALVFTQGHSQAQWGFEGKKEGKAKGVAWLRPLGFPAAADGIIVYFCNFQR